MQHGVMREHCFVHWGRKIKKHWGTIFQAQACYFDTLTWQFIYQGYWYTVLKLKSKTLNKRTKLWAASHITSALTTKKQRNTAEKDVWTNNQERGQRVGFGPGSGLFFIIIYGLALFDLSSFIVSKHVHRQPYEILLEWVYDKYYTYAPL